MSGNSVSSGTASVADLLLSQTAQVPEAIFPVPVGQLPVVIHPSHQVPAVQAGTRQVDHQVEDPVLDRVGAADLAEQVGQEVAPAV